MFNVQFHHKTNTLTRERFLKPSLTEPDNAMSIPEIISRYMRGHGLAVPVLPDNSGMAAREDGETVVDDPYLGFDNDDDYAAYLKSREQVEPAQNKQQLDKEVSSSE